MTTPLHKMVGDALERKAAEDRRINNTKRVNGSLERLYVDMPRVLKALRAQQHQMNTAESIKSLDQVFKKAQEHADAVVAAGEQMRADLNGLHSFHLERLDPDSL